MIDYTTKLSPRCDARSTLFTHYRCRYHEPTCRENSVCKSAVVISSSRCVFVAKHMARCLLICGENRLAAESHSDMGHSSESRGGGEPTLDRWRCLRHHHDPHHLQSICPPLVVFLFWVVLVALWTQRVVPPFDCILSSLELGRDQRPLHLVVFMHLQKNSVMLWEPLQPHDLSLFCCFFWYGELSSMRGGCCRDWLLLHEQDRTSNWADQREMCAAYKESHMAN